MSNENPAVVNWSGLEADLAERAMERRQAAVDRLLKLVGEQVDEEGDEQARWLDPDTGNFYNLLHFYDVPVHGSEVYIIEAQSVLRPTQSASVIFDRGSPEITVLHGDFANELQAQAALGVVLESVLNNAARIVSGA